MHSAKCSCGPEWDASAFTWIYTPTYYVGQDHQMARGGSPVLFYDGRGGLSISPHLSSLIRHSSGHYFRQRCPVYIRAVDSSGRKPGVQLHWTAAYKPQGNGLYEPFHRSMKTALQATLIDRTWLVCLLWVTLGLQSALKEEF